MQDRVAAITGHLYEGVLMPDAWHSALDGMSNQLSAGVFHSFTLAPAGMLIPESTGNLESFGLHAGLMSEYETHHAANDLRAAATMRMPMGQVMLDHEQISPRAMSHNAVYSDWLVPLGLRHTAAVIVRVEAGAQDFISFMRPSDAKPYGTQDKTFIDQLTPHIMRAARLRARAVQLSQHATLGLAALDTLPRGLAVMDAQCRIHYANPAAERLLSPPSALRLIRGRLQCMQGASQSRLRQLAVGACTRPSRAGALELAGGSQRLVVTVLPLKAGHMLSAIRQAPMALVVLSVPGAIPPLDQRLIRDMLNLSPAEARLLLLLAAGKTVKDFAGLEGCSWHTARTHLKNLMHKTGCHRQAELVQLVQALRVG